MSTKVKTGWLHDKNGDKFAPKTLISQVQTGDGTLLEDKLQADLDAAKTEILEETKELVVTITQADDGTYYADHYAAEINAHFKAGGRVVATINNMRHLLLAMYDEMAVFHLEIGHPLIDTAYANKFVFVGLDSVDVDANEFDVMTGATDTTDGKFGFVPAPAAGDQGKFLRGDGVWVGEPNEDDALELVTELGLIEPMADDEGNVLTDENGALYTL